MAVTYSTLSVSRRLFHAHEPDARFRCLDYPSGHIGSHNKGSLGEIRASREEYSEHISHRSSPLGGLIASVSGSESGNFISGISHPFRTRI